MPRRTSVCAWLSRDTLSLSLGSLSLPRQALSALHVSRLISSRRVSSRRVSSRRVSSCHVSSRHVSSRRVSTFNFMRVYGWLKMHRYLWRSCSNLKTEKAIPAYTTYKIKF